MYRSTEAKQIVISFRGTVSPKDMLTDMALDLAAFDPADKKDVRSPDEVAEDMSEEEMENGPLGGLYKGMKVTGLVLFKLRCWCLQKEILHCKYAMNPRNS